MMFINIGENGRFSRLLGVSRKRKQHQMEEDKASSNQKELKSKLDDKSKKIEDLITQVDKFKKERVLFIKDSAKLDKLYQMGIIDDHGDPLQLRPDESEYMKA